MANPEVVSSDTEEEITERREDTVANKFHRSVYSIPVNVTVSIGQKRLSVSEILDLRPDSVVALASRIEDPVSLMVDDKLIARGELIETEEGGLGVKITE
ncbi:FliM/FliN family flagellar motor switch protein, partial [Henriciella aquimarina]|uniref:FliM/FliN family flagellar motor switch protein n=1 Tax=Henriciella aquimarina TaxID=545261 RepID=UPI000A00A18A